jgi:hypothetical protein
LPGISQGAFGEIPQAFEVVEGSLERAWLIEGVVGIQELIGQGIGVQRRLAPLPEEVACEVRCAGRAMPEMGWPARNHGDVCEVADEVLGVSLRQKDDLLGGAELVLSWVHGPEKRALDGLGGPLQNLSVDKLELVGRHSTITPRRTNSRAAFVRSGTRGEKVARLSE